MKNISFDNPYLLLIAIPLLILLAVPFFLAVKKNMRNRNTIISLALHVVIVILATLAVAGASIISVMTETHVYVVADVSYSSNANLDLIDGYIDELEGKLPVNSKLGVVCFGKDAEVLTDVGEVRKSVKESSVDTSATDISSALDYTASLFEDGVIKRIVLISDGKETGSGASGRLVSSVESLYSSGIYIDAVYLDNNLGSDAKEIQISDVELSEVSYLNRQSSANVLIQSSYDANAIATLYCGDEKIEDKALSLNSGFNSVRFDLLTDSTGVFDYKVTVSEGSDESDKNNSVSFTQRVAGNIKVLLLTSKKADVAAARNLYGEDAEIDAYVYSANKAYKVPDTIDELCEYDEILISDLDVRSITNATAFLDSLNKAVSLFGKSLLTFGDLNLQNKTDDEVELKALQQLLPVNYGNDDRDAKLYALVLDMSRSMQENYERFRIMKETAIQIVNLLCDNSASTGEGEDSVTKITVVSFAGDIYVPQSRVSVENKDKIIETIRSLEPEQGTAIGAALSRALADLKGGNYRERTAILVSDGLNFAFEAENPTVVAEQMYKEGITISALQPIPPTSDEMGAVGAGEQTLRSIAAAAHGKYYQINSLADVRDVIGDEVADDLTETVVEQRSPVKIVKPKDEVLDGVTVLGDVNGFVYGNSKSNVQTVLTVDYIKKTGQVTTSPLYVYQNCGNGRVAVLMTSLSGDWISEWSSPVGTRFLQNILFTNIPERRIDYPYIVTVESDGSSATIDMLPASVYPDSVVTAQITDPTGASVESNLSFNSERYVYKFDTPDVGEYTIKISYSYSDKVFESETYLNVSYSPEYDRFEVFDPSALYSAIRTRGTVNEGTVPTLENNSKEVATYELSLAVPLLIAAISLYVVDIIVRKLKWNDIKTLFKKSKGGR